MATFTVYSDAACSQVIGSGFVGEYFEIRGSTPFIVTHNQNRTIDEETVRFDQIQSFLESSVQSFSEATEIPIEPTPTKELQTIYFSPDTSYSFYCWGSGHAFYFESGSFAARFNGSTWENVTAISSQPYGPVYDVSGLCFRTGSGAHYDGTQYLPGSFFGVDFVSLSNQGQKEIRRCVIACSPENQVFIEGDLHPYKPPTGSKRRGGTGSGYYPNSVVPALPTGAINAALSSILGQGNGLTYYKLTGNSFTEITEYLYDCAPTLKFRNSVYRDAIASCILIPYNVNPDVTNTLGLVYLANKSIPVSGGCDIVTTPLKEINFGIVDLTAANIGFRNFADYIHTTAVLYLPCFGAVNIDMSAISGGILSLRGVLDVRNGNILYRLETRAEMDDTPVLYGQYTGQCGIPVPIGGANAQMSVMGAISSIGSIGVGIASGNPLNIVGGISSLASQTAPSIDISGAMQPLGAALGTPVPILQIRKHVMSAPPDYEEIHGLPSDATLDGVYDPDVKTLGDYQGFFRAAVVDVSGLSGATDQEKSEIEQLLKEGVFV